MATDAGSSTRWSGPTSILATCGITSPTQPMIPLMETAAAVTTVAQPITTIRSSSTLTPSDRASSSPSESTLSRQRSSSSPPMPNAISGSASTRSRVEDVLKLPSSQNTMAGSFRCGSTV